MKKLSPIPIQARMALKKLGEDIRDARRRRRLSTALMAERASISRTTLSKVEKGSPTVSMGIYATILFILGMTPRLSVVADVRFDETGLILEEEHLPKRIRYKVPKSSKEDN